MYLGANTETNNFSLYHCLTHSDIQLLKQTRESLLTASFRFTVFFFAPSGQRLELQWALTEVHRGRKHAAPYRLEEQKSEQLITKLPEMHYLYQIGQA